MIKEQDIISKIKAGDGRILSTLYKENAVKMKKTIKGLYPLLSMEVIEECVDDSFHALYRNIMDDKLTELKSKASTYLTQIAKFKAIDCIRKHQSSANIDDLVNYIPSDDMSGLDIFDENDVESQKNLIVAQVVKSMTEPCKTILVYSYYKEKKDKEIVELTDYTSTATVKNQRSRCMKTLRKACTVEFVSKNLISRNQMKTLIGK